MISARLALVAFIFSIIFVIYKANAADPMGQLPVLARNFPEFSAKGFRLGTFDVFPSIDTQVNYTSNVLKSDTNKISDKLLKNRIDINVSKSANNYNLTFGGGVDKLTYQKTSDFDTINFKGFSGLQYDITNGVNASMDAYFQRAHETQYETGTIDAAFDPIQVDEIGFLKAFKFETGPIGWNLKGSVRNLSHNNTKIFTTGAELIQEDRDRTVYSTGFDASLNSFSSKGGTGFTPFIGFNLTRSDFDKRNFDTGTNDFTGLDQSNTRYDYTAGIQINPTAKLRGTVRAGYGIYEADEGQTSTKGAGIVDIDLTYLYTPLTNFIFGADRFFSDDTGNTGGTLQTNLSAKIIHELTRRWILDASVGYTTREFDTNGKDNTWDGGIGFTHRINERFTLDGDLKYISRESNQDNGDYDEGRAMIRLKTKF